ncbi:MAG: hypothetical protein C0598_08790, partial [Marinilabiliales bacterium]
MLLRKGIILLYLIAITYCNTVIIGQNTYINYPASETDTTHNNSDTTRILDYLYASISEVGIINNEEYLNKARLLAEEKNKLDFLADRADSLGVTERNRGNYSKAIRLHQLALEISELTGNKQYASIFNNNLGVVYRRIDEYDKAMKYHHKALKLAELIDNTRSKSIAINSLGNIQMIIGNNDEAHEYFKQSLKLEEDAGNLLGIAINLNNIGNIYFHDKDYNKAKEYYQKSLKINKSINSLRGIGICYSDLGAVYEDEGNYKESLIYYNKALSVNLQHGDKIYLSDNYIHLGILNYKLGELKKAENFFTKGLRIAKKIGAKEVIKDAHNGLYKINYDRRKYKNAILHSDTFHIYKDSIMSSNLRKEIARLKISYDSERKESLISSLEQRSKIDQLEIKRQKNIFLLTLSGFIIALISISFLVIYIRYKSKSTRILQRKNEEIDRARYNLKKLADDLYIAKQKAEQSDKIKSEFLANMSHEIRTPLNGVIGFTDLLEKNISDPGLLKYLKSIKVSSNILLTLINDILDLSKIEAGKIYVKYRALNIRDLCYELEQIFESKSNDNNNTLEFNISNSTPILINFSDLRLRQILLNLISNAIKFTRNGNIDISFH